MPNQYDDTYHLRQAQPVYDTEKDKRYIQTQREVDGILELKPPRVPTQQDENAYMEFLKEDFMSDPWATYRFRKYMAGPKRIPWKNHRQIKR